MPPPVTNISPLLTGPTVRSAPGIVPSAIPRPRHRVYHVIARLNVGGPAVHVSLLASRQRAGFDTMILTGTVGPHEGDMTYFAREQGIDPVILEGMGRELDPVADLRLLWRLYRIFRRERPAVVHTHTAKAGAVGRLAAWLAGVPVIVHTFHGHVLHGYFGAARTRIFLEIERLLSRVTDCIVTLGERQRDEILGFGIGSPSTVKAVPLGLDLERLLSLDRQPGDLQKRLGLAPGAPLVGIVARMVPIKGHEVFLRAARLVADRQPAVSFVLVGDGERRSELERLVAELGLAGRVHFLGWQADLVPVYADLTCLALSSVNEGLPTALIEAHAAAVPVVSTPVGSVAEIVEDGRTGYLTPVGDERAMADRLEQLLSDPASARAMGMRGRERVRERFGLHRLLGDVDVLYRSLLTRKGLDHP